MAKKTIKKEVEEVIVEETIVEESTEKKALRDTIELFKIQNPEKYEIEKESLYAQLNTLK